MAEDAAKKNGASENPISSGGERLYSLAIAAANVDPRPNSSQRTATKLLQESQVKTFNVKGKGVERHLPNIGWHQQPMASRFENRLESSLSPMELSAACVDGFYPTPNPGCAYAELHRMGSFCHSCRGISTPWGLTPPIISDKWGHAITTAPKGALLEGMRNLRDSFEIAVLCILIFLDLRNQAYEAVPKLFEVMHRYPYVRDVAYRILRLIADLCDALDGQAFIPRWYEIVHDALCLPSITRDQYFEKVLLSPGRYGPSEVHQTLSNHLISADEAIKAYTILHGEDQGTKLREYLMDFASRGPGYVQYTISVLDWQRMGGQDLGIPCPQMTQYFRDQYETARLQVSAQSRGRDYKSLDFNPQAYLRPSAGSKYFSRNSTKQYFTQQNDHDTDIEICEPEESNSGNDPIFIVVTRTKGLKSGRTSTSWRFVDGTDTSYAVVGNPEPGKFYFTCESVDNSANIEAYQYNGIANFKWDNPHHIDQLNHARSGLQSRIFGGFADKSFPLTVMEKEALKDEVRDAVNAGFNKHTMDWDWVAKSLKNRFKDVIQPKGVRLALGPDHGELHNGVRGERLSPSARIGYSRTAAETAAQASNYQDILEMMNGTVGRAH